MANVRKTIAKKTLSATKAQAEQLEAKQKAQAEAGAVAKVAAKTVTKTAPKKAKPTTASKPKKVSVKGKTTKQIKKKLNENSTLHPLGGLSGEALIKHHQSRVEFLRKHPEENKSIHPKGLKFGVSRHKAARHRINQQALREIHQERDKSDNKGNGLAGQWNERHRCIANGAI